MQNRKKKIIVSLALLSPLYDCLMAPLLLLTVGTGLYAHHRQVGDPNRIAHAKKKKKEKNFIYFTRPVQRQSGP